MGLASVIVTGLLASPSILPAAGSGWDAKDLLLDGMRIKVEGRLRGEGVYRADGVKLKGDRKESLRVEGILKEVDGDGGSLDIAGVHLSFDAETEFLDAGGDTIAPEKITPGGRVRAHVTWVRGSLRATSLRMLDSRDLDTEITATVERISLRDSRRMEIVVLGKTFKCDENTAFTDPDGGRMDFDFTGLDIYQRLVDTDDQRPRDQFSLGELLTVGGEFQVDMIPEDNFDLYDFETASDVIYSKLSSRLEFSSSPHPDVDLFEKGAVNDPVGPYDPFHPVRSEGSLKLAEASLLWKKVFTRRLGLEIGRQRFDEKREWLYNRNLDGVRVFLNLGPTHTEISWTENMSETKEQDKGVINYMLYSSWEMSRHREMAFYVIDREDMDHPDINFDRRYYGLRSFGSVGKSIDYWIEGAIMRGERNGRALDGNAFDVGFTQSLRGVPFEPSFTLGYAYGSGDKDYRDNIDGNFRQTGFDRNNDKFNGVNSFKYYGELFNPELSNMRIFTADLGFRWSRQGSFDIVYHTFQQVVAKQNVHGGNLLTEPWGTFKDIGDEIDLLTGYEKLWGRIDMELILGVFRPGWAFGPFLDAATRTKLEIEYNF